MVQTMRASASNEPDLISLGGRDFNTAVAGGKASSLHRLMIEGYPVPPGFVVPANAEFDCIGSELEIAVTALGGYPVAVRSSAQLEDLAAASFAGQYATYLKITTLTGLIEAIEACRASGKHEHALSYLHKNGYQANGAQISALVQKVVDASVAGVVFSIDPQTGR